MAAWRAVGGGCVGVGWRWQMLAATRRDTPRRRPHLPSSTAHGGGREWTLPSSGLLPGLACLALIPLLAQTRVAMAFLFRSSNPPPGDGTMEASSSHRVGTPEEAGTLSPCPALPRHLV